MHVDKSFEVTLVSPVREFVTFDCYKFNCTSALELYFGTLLIWIWIYLRFDILINLHCILDLYCIKLLLCKT